MPASSRARCARCSEVPASFAVACPACGATSSRVPLELAGRVLRCPRCQSRFTAPRPDDEPLPTVPEAAPSAPPAAAIAPTVAEAGSAPSGTTPDWVPGATILGLYEVVAVLGHGGMGRVYRVRHRGWGLDLALKVPLAQVLAAVGGADLFVKEAETWVNLGLHPHVVTCHYVRRLEGRPLVFAEYADGGSVHEAIREGRLSAVEAILDVAVQFAWGLHHAHEQGLVHRDVKPANVMLTSDGLAKVTDFGLARARSGRLAAGAGGGHTMTVEGGGGLTPAYVSPEQARGEAMSRRSDAWSFGLCVLEMFLGRRTWQLGLAGPDVLAALDASGGGGAPMPPRVRALLERCFRERPDERPHDMAEIAAELRGAWESVAGRSYPRPEPKGGLGSPDALNNRAASLVDLGRAHEATGLWARALQAEPLHLEATYNAALHAWAQAKIADPELLRRMEEACAPRAGAPRADELLSRVRALVGPRVAGATERSDAGPAAAATRTLRGLRGALTGLTTTPDGSLVVAAAERELRIWRALDGELVHTLAVAEGPARALLALRDGRSLLVAAEGAPLTVWDLASGRSLRAFARHPGVSTSLAEARSGRILVSGGSDRVVRLWDPATGRCLRELAGHEDGVTAVAAGEEIVASASRDGSVRLWSLADGVCLGVLRGHEGRVLAVAVRESDARVVSAGEDGLVADWGLRSRQVVRGYVSHPLAVPALVLSPDGRQIVSGGIDRTLRGFEPETETLSFVCRLEGAVQALAWGAHDTVWAGHGSSVSAVRPSPLALPRTALCRPASAREEDERSASFESHVAQARRSFDAGDLAAAFHFARTARSVPGRERALAAVAVWDDVCARAAAQDPALGLGASPDRRPRRRGAGRRLRSRRGLDRHGGARRLDPLLGRRRAQRAAGPLRPRRRRHRRRVRGPRGADRLLRPRPDAAALGREPAARRSPSSRATPSRSPTSTWPAGTLRSRPRPAGTAPSACGTCAGVPPRPSARGTPRRSRPCASLRTASCWRARAGTARCACGTPRRPSRSAASPRTTRTRPRWRGTRAAASSRAEARTGRSRCTTPGPGGGCASCPGTRARSRASPTRPTADSSSPRAAIEPCAPGTCAGASRSARCRTRRWSSVSLWTRRQGCWRPRAIARRGRSTSTGSRRPRARRECRRRGPTALPRRPRCATSCGAWRRPGARSRVAAARAARRVPWRWLALAAVVLASVLVSYQLAWRRPASRPRLSPLAPGVRSEVDLIELRGLRPPLRRGGLRAAPARAGVRQPGRARRRVRRRARHGRDGRRRARRRAARRGRPDGEPAAAPQRRLRADRRLAGGRAGALLPALGPEARGARHRRARARHDRRTRRSTPASRRSPAPAAAPRRRRPRRRCASVSRGS